MNVPLTLVGLLGISLRTSEDAKNVDLGNLLLAGSLVATVTRPREVQELQSPQGS